jgi:hypothetical protein
VNLGDRFERRTGILIGTFRLGDHWTSRMPIHVGPVGSWGQDVHARGYWRMWVHASGVSVSSFDRAAYVVVSRFSDDRDRLAFWAGVATIATALGALVVVL